MRIALTAVAAARRCAAPALKRALHRNGARRSRTLTTSSRPSDVGESRRRPAAATPRPCRDAVTRSGTHRKAPLRHRAQAADRPRPARQSDTLDLGTTSITGNAELPKVLYIVPWKKSDLGDLVGRPVNTLLDEVLAPVDPAVFERHLSYYDSLYGKQREQE